MIRKSAAAVLGVLAAIAIVAAVEALGHAVYPVPADLDISDAAQFANYVETLPIGAFLFVLAAWLLGTLGGGVLAAYIARESIIFFSTIVGAFILLASVANLVLIPHPLWFSVTAVISIAVMTYLTGQIATSLITSSTKQEQGQ